MKTICPNCEIEPLAKNLVRQICDPCKEIIFPCMVCTEEGDLKCAKCPV